MIAYFKLTVSYPDGGVEEIEQDFHSLREAVEYGEALLGQIPSNAPFKGRSGFEPRFRVARVDDSGRKVVFDSAK